MRTLYCCLLFVLTCCTAYTATPLQTNNTHLFTLKNGLTVLFRRDNRAPVIITQVWYKVGSSDEPNGLTGISHALEHMMFEGTIQHPEGEYNQLITQNGGSFNAWTNTDFTTYYEKLSADKLALSFELEADRMQHLQFTQQAFDKEMKVVHEERRQRIDDNPVMLTYERFMAAANLSNPYHHLPIGWPSDIEHLTKENLQSWYQTWYVPNNAILVVVGDTTLQEVTKLADKYFGAIPKGSIPTTKPHPPQRPLGKHILSINLPAQLPSIIMGYNVPSVLTTTIDWEPYALDMLAAILDGGDSARIPRDMIRGQAIATEAGVSYQPYSRYSQQFIFSGMPAQNHSVDALINGFQAQIHTLQNNLVTQADLQRVINQLIAQKIYSQDTLINQASEMGQMVGLNKPWHEIEHYLHMIKRVTPAQVQTVAKKYLTDENLTLATLIPTKTPLDTR